MCIVKKEIVLMMMSMMVGVMVGCKREDSGSKGEGEINSKSSNLVWRQSVSISTPGAGGSYNETLARGQVYGCPGISFGRGEHCTFLTNKKVERNYTNVAPWDQASWSSKHGEVFRRNRAKIEELQKARKERIKEIEAEQENSQSFHVRKLRVLRIRH